MSELQPREPGRGMGLIEWFARNPVAANLLMIAILVAGTFSAFSIRKEFFPEIVTNTITVNVPYPGSTPEEVEEGVVIKIEEAVQDLEGIKEITSHARENSGQVTIEVEAGYDVRDMLDKVKNRVDAISTFPEETERLTIYENTIRHQVIWVQVIADTDERSLKEIAKDIREEILALPEVTQADLVGARNYEIAIEVSEITLREYGLTFAEVVSAVQASSLDLPAGSIKTAGGEILLRTKGQAYVGDEFGDIVLRTRPDGTRLLVRDIATIVDGFEERESMFRYNGIDSMGIQIFRVGDQNVLDLTAAVKRYVAERNQTLPAGVQLETWQDMSRVLNDRLSLMLKNAFFGGLLVLALLTLFLRPSLAFWVMVGIPVCFLGTLMVMPIEAIDVSINMITLFGFILVLGIVVDDAIVIGESVYTTTRKEGYRIENVIRGAQRVAMPATFGVLTTIAAFIPMLMIPGATGEIWKGIAWVVVLCLVFSLVESKLILPAHLAHLKPPPAGGHRSPLMKLQSAIADGLEGFVSKRYKPAMAFCMRWRYPTAAAFVASLILTIGLLQSGWVRSVMFPRVPSDFLRANVSMAEGTPPEVTRRAAAQIENAVLAANDAYITESGREEGFLKHTLSWLWSDQNAGFYVELTPNEVRDIGTMEVVKRWREAVGPIPGAIELNFRGEVGGPGGSPISFRFKGEKYDDLNAVAEAVKAKLETYAGVFDIEDSFSSGKQEVRLDIKPEAEAYGLTRADLARQVRQGFYGAEAQRIQRGKDEIRVMVRYPRSERESLGDLEDMRLRTPTGGEVPFFTVAEASLDRGFNTIRRTDRQRIINVTADVDKAAISPAEVIDDVEKNFLPGLLAQYPGVAFSLEGEARDRRESIGALQEGGTLALLVIFALMAIPLKSYVQPLIIMSVIPFGIVGAVFGHLVMGLEVSLLSMCGMVALSGVVVNDSLVMVDFINRHKEAGMDRMTAVREAGALRFRAILLTSLTTIAGLMPMLSEKSLQAQFLIPMATSLAFGIAFATVITLFLIPSLYLILDDIGRAFRRGKTVIWGEKPQGAPEPAESLAMSRD